MTFQAMSHFRLEQKFTLGTWVTVREDRRRAIGKNVSGTPALISAVSSEDGATILYPDLLAFGSRGYFREENVPLSKLRHHEGPVKVVERKLIQALREERRDMREKQTAIGEDAERQLQLQLPGMKRKRSPEPEAVCDAPARECNLSPATPMQDQPQEHITTPEKKAHTTPRITPEKTPRPTEADHASPLTAETTAVVVRAISKAFRSAGTQVLTLPAIDKVVKDLALGSSTQEILEKLESQNKVMVTDDLCFCIA
mmetsp:Transcript_92047/g.219225  ORF Transcript_92047/g.219225 Transcript_92047/m.219225 type:complete len:256 (-) Transcript_92047:86-853(-)|eukprot:CAMPEP_0181440592 /NCGR_PEP_ID=MMETSP1110-20121109/23050_1 /TAXON_ID=174948 /ORGANISM="Symbiodinium sp., Strain CCMP421" /LENGTH=255 /DNA_ID=CAMNT_0023564407 /DNA_START=24 /DNA_END=791 /DNA_ORIENTATION=-